MPCILFVSGQNLSSGQLKIFLTQVEKNKDWVAMDAASNVLTLASLEPLTHIVCGPASLADLATQLKRICFVKPSQKQDRRAWTDAAIAELVGGSLVVNKQWFASAKKNSASVPAGPFLIHAAAPDEEGVGDGGRKRQKTDDSASSADSGSFVRWYGSERRHAALLAR